MNSQHEILIQDADPRLLPDLLSQPFKDAVIALHKADTQDQVVGYDEYRINYFQYVSDTGDELRFSSQWNPQRGERPKNPPMPAQCPIDLAGIIQQGRQRWFTFDLFGRRMVCLSNPFAYMPYHITVASYAHEPQSWRTSDVAVMRQRIERSFRDIFKLAQLLPGFVVIYNGDEFSGASLPQHQHYQSFALPFGHGPLAIQQAAAKQLAHHASPLVRVGFANDYPVCAFRLADKKEKVVQVGADLIAQWEKRQGEAATANLIAATENGQICIYVVLRNALFRYAPGFSGVIGSLEVAGSFVCSAEWEFEAVRQGRINFRRLWQMLEAVRPAAALHMR
jgi:hypothetical protein